MQQLMVSSIYHHKPMSSFYRIVSIKAGFAKLKDMYIAAAAAAAKSLHLCLTLCDPIDGSPPGFPIPGILQARTLEWVAISFFNALLYFNSYFFLLHSYSHQQMPISSYHLQDRCYQSFCISQ